MSQEKNGKYVFGTVRVGERGQIVIPKDARDLFDIHPGDTIVVLGDKKRGLAIPPQELFKHLANSVFDEEDEEGEE